VKYTASDKDVFISYAHQDQEWAVWIARQLDEAGYSTIYQARDFQPGTNFVVSMHEASRRAHHTLVVLSPDYLRSRFANAERVAAFRADPTGQQSKVIPVRVRACSPDGLLGAIVYIDLVDLGMGEAAAKVLCDGIRAHQPSLAETTSNGDDGPGNPRSDPTGGLGDKGGKDSGFDRDDLLMLERAGWFHRALEFFEDRLCEAFPGVRRLREFSGPEAVTRLGRLLREPLQLGKHSNAPLWWWRGRSDLPIDHFEVLDRDGSLCLLNQDELIVDQVFVYRSRRVYQSFVYIATHPSQPTGLYPPMTPEQLDADIRLYGYVYETVGYWQGRYLRWEEYTDGYTEIDGDIVELKAATERTRYFTPYNLFITSQTSVLNSIGFDKRLDKICRTLLQGTVGMEQVINEIESLELTGQVRYYYFLTE
jgi:hypothetical protein